MKKSLDFLVLAGGGGETECDAWWEMGLPIVSYDIHAHGILGKTLGIICRTDYDVWAVARGFIRSY